MYRIIIEFPVYSMDDIMLGNQIVGPIEEKYDIEMGGSGTGFGYRDMDWYAESEKIAKEMAEDLEKAFKKKFPETEVRYFEDEDYEE